MACFHPVNSLAVYLKKGSFDGGPQNKLSSFSICNNNNKVTQARCLLLHIDSTYKLLWLDNLVHIAGIGDFNNRFHSFILCVCTKEEAEDNEFLCHSLQNGISLIGINKP